MLHAEALIEQHGKNLFEFLIEMLFEHIDNPGRELKLQNVSLMRQ